ncbi:MAG TPA: transporter [Thermoanaerobaculia bacterium]|nr:transporter [Thermoanaerobaculia bacterium]
MKAAAAFVFGALSAAVLSGQQAAPIQDNSFLLEEAYNQEEGVVQHITTFQRFRGGSWSATFTQEWPVPGQTHQLSYTVAWARVGGEEDFSEGIGDVALNYRYQLAGNGDAKFACAPRVSVLIPTGDSSRGLGSGSAGLQFDVAASTVLSSRFVAHTNLGSTWLPRAKNRRGDRAATLAWNAGQSVIWTALPTFNVLLETAWTHFENVLGPRRVGTAQAFFVSPGIRWAWNLPSGLQIVPGLAVPVGVGPSRADRAVFVYLSFEHAMWSPERP